MGEEFYSLSKQKKKGTVMYIKQELQLKKLFNDGDGRYLAVEIELNMKKKTFSLEVYAPMGAKRDLD